MFELSRRNLSNLISESFKDEKGHYQMDPYFVRQCIDRVFNDIENEMREEIKSVVKEVLEVES